MFLFVEKIVASHKKITNNKSQSIGESIPRWGYTHTVERYIKNRHLSTRVIQYKGFLFCEVIFFDFCRWVHMM